MVNPFTAVIGEWCPKFFENPSALYELDHSYTDTPWSLQTTPNRFRHHDFPVRSFTPPYKFFFIFATDFSFHRRRAAHHQHVRRGASGVWCSGTQSKGPTAGTAPLWNPQSPWGSPGCCTAGIRSLAPHTCGPRWQDCDRERNPQLVLPLFH